MRQTEDRRRDLRVGTVFCGLQPSDAPLDTVRSLGIVSQLCEGSITMAIDGSRTEPHRQDVRSGQPDFSELAFRLVERMTDEDGAVSPEESSHAVAGRKGGEARAKALTAAERAAIARKGGEARWAQPSA